MRNKAKSQQGSVLFTVVVVSMMMMVLTASAVSLVGHTSTETNKEYRSKQAYFMASSCLEGFVSEVTSWTEDVGLTSDDIEEEINKLKDIAASGTEIEVEITDQYGTPFADSDYAPADVRARGFGTCKIKVVENGSSNNLKAIATAQYLDCEETVVAYFAVKPISAQKPMNNALEIIGTDGGGNNGYNNVEVYGNTAASSISSHNNNTWYKLQANDSKFGGNMTMLGSVTLSTGYTLDKNSYYVEGVDNDQTPGGTLTVSRSLSIGNRASVVSTLEKKSTNTDEPTYNYVNVGECLIMGGVSNTKIGSTADTQVDIYASSIVFGTLSSAPEELRNAVVSSVSPAEKQADYLADMEGERGQEQVVNGNIYTYDVGGAFDGSIYFNGINNHIYGDIYCSGDIYFNTSSVDFTGNIYILPGKTIYNLPSGIDPSRIIQVDWTTYGGRANRPAINTTSSTVQEYVYYPEHMLCTDGVSTIKNTYASMYDASNNILPTVKDITDASFRNDSGDLIEGIRFDYIVTESCVISNLDNKKILIDMDNAVENADGKHDIVVIMKNGGNMGNGNMILVRNSSSDESESDDPRFCYFVSDSGVGITNNEYAADNSSVSTYDSSTFKTSVFTFGRTNFKLMDLETYLNSNLNAANTGSGRLNLTDKEIEDSYPVKSGKIIILLTEGSRLETCNDGDLLLQASIYAPKATVSLQHNSSVALEPFIGNTNVAVLGSVICNQFQASANNIGIAYHEVSSKSMLPMAKGSKSIYTEGFKLINYSNS